MMPKNKVLSYSAPPFSQFMYQSKSSSLFPIEFCNCDNLEKYLHAKMAEEQVHKMQTIVRLVQKMKSWANDAKKAIRQRNQEVRGIGYKIKQISSSDLEGKPDVCMEKLKNLTKRQNVYGDITQNASPEELENLLRYHENHVPDVSFSTKYLSIYL